MEPNPKLIKPIKQERRKAKPRPMADGRRLYDDPLRTLPGEYYRAGDLRVFMERASPWILEYCRGRLSRDPDLIGDFYLHFYERADRCLEKYRHRPHMPFTGFLATYLRREFLNFKRNQTSLVHEVHAPEIFGEQEISSMVFPSSRDTDALKKALPRIQELPVRFRLPLKLYYGLMLDASELRHFVRLHRSPLVASRFLREFHQRREKLRESTQQRTHRAAHLMLLIHDADRQTDHVAARRRRRWKRNLEHIQTRERRLFSLTELARLFGVTKSSVSRRIKRGIELMQAN